MSDARDNIIDLFRKGTFPYKGNVFKTKEEENKLEKIKDDYEKFFKYIEDESKEINYELFENYFKFVAPTALTKTYEMKNKMENDKLVKVIKSGLIDLKDEIEKVSKKETENENPDKILKIVEEILEFNKQK